MQTTPSNPSFPHQQVHAAQPIRDPLHKQLPRADRCTIENIAAAIISIRVLYDDRVPSLVAPPFEALEGDFCDLLEVVYGHALYAELALQGEVEERQDGEMEVAEVQGLLQDHLYELI